MNFFKKMSTASLLESEIGTLEGRREALEGKLSAATEAIEVARAEQRERLIGGDDDAGPSRNTEDKTIAGEREVNSIQAAIVEIDTRFADARNRLAAARENEAREKAACDRENEAAAIEKASLTLEQAVETVAVAFEKLADAITDGSGAMIYEYLIGPRPATPLETARAILASGADLSRCRVEHTSRFGRSSKIHDFPQYTVIREGKASSSTSKSRP